MDIEPIIESFFQGVAKGQIEIYNEFSLQHELGCFLRISLGSDRFRVQFERPVEFFALNSAQFYKREIDIVVLDKTSTSKQAVELKFPRNGQYPEQMFKACEDIAFLEQLVSAGFDAGFFVMVADDRLFYRGPDNSGIYAYFRASQKLTGTITKPTGRRDSTVSIHGKHVLSWKHAEKYQYLCTRVDGTERWASAATVF